MYNEIEITTGVANHIEHPTSTERNKETVEMSDNKEHRCKKCQIVLFNDDEIDQKICGNCADIEFEKYKEREEWNYFHNDIGNKE